MAVKTGLPCDHCGSSDAVAEYPQNFFCFSCKTYTPKLVDLDYSPVEKKENHFSFTEIPLPTPATEYLLKCGLTVENNKDYLTYASVVYVGNFTYHNRLVLLVPTLTGTQADFKSLTGDLPKTVSVGQPKEPLFILNKNIQKLFIVEDCLSALKLREFGSVLALRGTTFPDSLLIKIKEYISLFLDNVVIYVWLDGDTPGLIAAQYVRNRLKWLIDETKVKIIHTKDDPKFIPRSRIQKLI